MTKHKLLTQLAVVVALFASPTVFARAANPTKPNIIFILADDLGYMDVGCFNPKTFYETPAIDSLAQRGMRFTQGYAACCVCSPTRGSIMTGKYPPRFGVTDFIGGKKAVKLTPPPNANHLPLEETTIAEALRDDGGYATFFAGKWHLGGGEFFPGAQGFPKELVSGGGGQFWFPKPTHPIADSKKDSKKGPHDDPKNDKDDPKATDRIASEAVRFINEHKDRPFFAYLPFLAPHVPIGARSELIAKYKQKAASAPTDSWGKERDSQVRQVQNNPVYAGMLEQLDTAIRRVLDAVEKNGLAEKTIIIFMSDNGGVATSEGHPTSNLPLRAGKGWPYEGGIREPLIVVAPGVAKPGSVCATPVISADFYPTLLQLAGLELKPTQHVDGVSMLPLLKGEKQERGKPLFWHYPHYGNQGGAPHGAIRAGDWKLIEWFEDNTLELYNIAQDIGEKQNLTAKHPEKLKELHDQLVAWRKEVKALMPQPNKDPHPAKSQ